MLLITRLPPGKLRAWSVSHSLCSSWQRLMATPVCPMQSSVNRRYRLHHFLEQHMTHYAALVCARRAGRRLRYGLCSTHPRSCLSASQPQRPSLCDLGTMCLYRIAPSGGTRTTLRISFVTPFFGEPHKD